MGNSLSGLYLRNRKGVGSSYLAGTLVGGGVGVQRHGVTLI